MTVKASFCHLASLVLLVFTSFVNDVKASRSECVNPSLITPTTNLYNGLSLTTVGGQTILERSALAERLWLVEVN